MLWSRPWSRSRTARARRGPTLSLASVASLASLALGTPAPGLAGPPEQPQAGGVEFRWDAPADDCPDEDRVVSEVERLLGGPVGEQGSERLAAIARVRREADGRWDLRLWTVTERETLQRSMVGEDCEVLAEAAALLAAMAIDPTVLERGSPSDAAREQAEQAQPVEAPEPPPDEPDPDTDPDPGPQPSSDDPATAEPPPPAVPGRRPGGWPRGTRAFLIALRAEVGLSFGDLPDIGPVARLAVALQWVHARVELEGHYGFLRRSRFDDNAELGADLRHAFAVARGCGVLAIERVRLEFPLCLGLEAGALLGEGAGFTEVEEGQIPWLALDFAPGLTWAPLEHLAVGLRVEPWVALLRRRFLAREDAGPREIWRPTPVGVRASVGLEARF